MWRWTWNGLLAFDRLASRWPQFIQMMLVDFAIAFCLGSVIAQVIDLRGGWGCPPVTDTSGFDGTYWAALGIGLFFLFFYLRGILKPRLVEGSWTPMIKTPLGIGGVNVALPNPRWTAHYNFLTSHPSYILLLLPMASIFYVMVLAASDYGCSVFYQLAFGWSGLAIMGLLALGRLVSWYGLRLGRDRIENDFDGPVGAARLSWEIAWKPVIVLVVLMHAIVLVPVGIMFWQQMRVHDALPVASLADMESAGEYRRVEGFPKGEIRTWPPEGLGRGNNQYYGAGVLIALDEGGEALLFAGSHAISDLRSAYDEAKKTNTRLKMIGQILGTEIPEDKARYSRFTEDGFPLPNPAGRVLIEVGVYP